MSSVFETSRSMTERQAAGSMTWKSMLDFADPYHFDGGNRPVTPIVIVAMFLVRLTSERLADLLSRKAWPRRSSLPRSTRSGQCIMIAND